MKKQDGFKYGANEIENVIDVLLFMSLSSLLAIAVVTIIILCRMDRINKKIDDISSAPVATATPIEAEKKHEIRITNHPEPSDDKIVIEVILKEGEAK